MGDPRSLNCVRFVQLNMNGLRIAMDQILKRCTRKKADALLVQEPPLCSNYKI